MVRVFPSSDNKHKLIPKVRAKESWCAWSFPLPIRLAQSANTPFAFNSSPHFQKQAHDWSCLRWIDISGSYTVHLRCFFISSCTATDCNSFTAARPTPVQDFYPYQHFFDTFLTHSHATIIAAYIILFQFQEAYQMSNDISATFPLLTFFIGFGLGLILYPKIIGFHYDESTNRHP